MDCKVCHITFDTPNKFHRHLKKCSGLSQKEYYEKYLPKVDLWDGSVIEFKNLKGYNASTFNSKDNCINWFKSSNIDPLEKRRFLTDYFLNKEFQKAPSQAELRGSMVPSIIGIETSVGPYSEFNESVGLERRLFEFDQFEFNSIQVITDTREQKPLGNSRVEKLEVGDYTTEDNFCGVFVERKSLEDFIGTFSRKTNFDRFERELIRVRDLGFFLVVLCEVDFNSVMNWENRFSGGKSCGYTAISKMKQFMQKFNCCQFLFCKKAAHPNSLLEKVLSIGEAAKTTDLQLMHDLNKF